MSGHIGGICIMPASDTDNAKRAAGWVLPLHGHAYESNIYIHMCIYGRVFRVPTPQWYGSPGCTPFPSICKLLAAFLKSTLVFARSLLHF